MGKRWTRSPEQQAFLDSKMLSFPLATMKRTKGVFIADLQNEWFRRWPERPAVLGADVSPDALLSETQKALVARAIYTLKQIKTYVRWHGGKSRNARRQLVRQRLSAFLIPKQKRPRKKSLVEIYTGMFWETKIGPRVEEEMRKTKPQGEEGFKEYHARRIRTMVDIRNSFWKRESHEVIAAVKSEKEKMEDEVKEAGGDGEGEDSEPTHGSSDIENVVPFLWVVGKEIHDRTGWFISFFLGGMTAEGELRLSTMHSGVTTAGHTWAESTPGFTQKFGPAWTQFIRNAITPEMQRERADFHLRQVTGAAPTTPFDTSHDPSPPDVELLQIDDDELENLVGNGDPGNSGKTAADSTSSKTQGKKTTPPTPVVQPTSPDAGGTILTSLEASSAASIAPSLATTTAMSPPRGIEEEHVSSLPSRPGQATTANPSATNINNSPPASMMPDIIMERDLSTEPDDTESFMVNGLLFRREEHGVLMPVNTPPTDETRQVLLLPVVAPPDDDANHDGREDSVPDDKPTTRDPGQPAKGKRKRRAAKTAAPKNDTQGQAPRATTTTAQPVLAVGKRGSHAPSQAMENIDNAGQVPTRAVLGKRQPKVRRADEFERQLEDIERKEREERAKRVRRK